MAGSNTQWTRAGCSLLALQHVLSTGIEKHKSEGVDLMWAANDARVEEVVCLANQRNHQGQRGKPSVLALTSRPPPFFSTATLHNRIKLHC